MLKIGPEDVFYDIGCGKGRVLCVVARRPIQRVVGIEISESLCEKARENVDRLRGGLCSIEVVCADACDASLIDGTIYFLYNPFGVDTMRHVIDRIHSTLANNPRNIKVVYYNALHTDVLLNAGWLEKYASFLTKTEREVSFGEIAKPVINFRISKEANEIAWDDFLANATPGCHSQAGLWAQVKAAQGWKSIRLIGRDGSQIVGGAQVLYRTTPILGGIGYVKRGPVLAESNTELAGDLIEELIRLARSLRLRALYVEPPADQIDCKDVLNEYGFRPSTQSLSLPATTIVDLRKSEPELLSSMRSSKRRNIKRAAKSGIVVRRALGDDIGRFWKLLELTGRRQQFDPDAKKYLSDMWKVLRPRSCVELFFAEYSQDPISGSIFIRFGDTITYYRGAWSGKYPGCRPNELLFWKVMLWAKEQGVHWFDFDGIILDGKNTLTAFKLGFGGEVHHLHGTFEWFPNTLAKNTFHFMPNIENSALVRKILKRGRVEKVDH